MNENNNKRSLRNEKLQANKASETEEQRKERLRIRCKKDRARRRTKKLQEERESCQKQKTMRNRPGHSQKIEAYIESVSDILKKKQKQ